MHFQDTNVKLDDFVTTEARFPTTDFVATVLSILNVESTAFHSIPVPANSD